MSQHIYEDDNTRVVLGYDRPLGYVFCTVERGGEMIYSNLSDADAGTEQQDVRYYRSVLDRLGVTVPEEMFAAVESDQRARVGNRVVHHSSETPEQKFQEAELNDEGAQTTAGARKAILYIGSKLLALPCVNRRVPDTGDFGAVDATSYGCEEAC